MDHGHLPESLALWSQILTGTPDQAQVGHVGEMGVNKDNNKKILSVTDGIFSVAHVISFLIFEINSVTDEITSLTFEINFLLHETQNEYGAVGLDPSPLPSFFQSLDKKRG